MSIFFYPFFSIQFFVVLEAGGEYKNHFYSFLYLLLFFFRPIDIFGGFEADSSISSIFVRAIYFEQLSFHPRPIECCSKNLRSAILSHADADGESWNILSNLSRFLQFLCVCVCVCVLEEAENSENKIPAGYTLHFFLVNNSCKRGLCKSGRHFLRRATNTTQTIAHRFFPCVNIVSNYQLAENKYQLITSRDRIEVMKLIPTASNRSNKIKKCTAKKNGRLNISTKQNTKTEGGGKRAENEVHHFLHPCVVLENERRVLINNLPKQMFIFSAIYQRTHSLMKTMEAHKQGSLHISLNLFRMKNASL